MNKLTLSALALIMTLGLAACSQEDDEGADFEEAADNAGEMMDDAGDSIEEGAEDTADEMGEAADDAGDSMEEGYDEVTEDEK
ncbi:hypothetical protein ACJO5Y_10015 [Marinobacter sp. GN3S48]|uniref:hypothetical protein n=1 Tax=Marinobacter sp. GN3S48 TaxID=3382302 RepID=UPI00387B8F72